MFSPQNKVPGVYIEEVSVAGPIQGLSTSIAAFIGPIMEKNLPEFVTLEKNKEHNTNIDNKITELDVIISNLETAIQDNEAALGAETDDEKKKIIQEAIDKQEKELQTQRTLKTDITEMKISEEQLTELENNLESVKRVLKYKMYTFSNWTQFSTNFGGYGIDDVYNTSASIHGFFANGGNLLKFYCLGIKEENESDASTENPNSNDKYENAIIELYKEKDVSIICVPDCFDIIVQQKILKHCSEMHDRFAILDVDKDIDLEEDDKLINLKGNFATNGQYGAVYFPWIEIPIDEETRYIPPSGYIAGMYARVDSIKGVHKAPANESLIGVTGLDKMFDDSYQGRLNENSINVIKKSTDRGILVWGGRTLSLTNQWIYINVRRLVLYIEDSIRKATEFAIFEPNNISLWKTLKRQINGFLNEVWKTGALVGQTPDDAFNVKIDEENNPADSRKQGILNIQIVIYPTTPTEFIVINIIQKPGGSSVEE